MVQAVMVLNKLKPAKPLDIMPQWNVHQVMRVFIAGKIHDAGGSCAPEDLNTRQPLKKTEE